MAHTLLTSVKLHPCYDIYEFGVLSLYRSRRVGAEWNYRVGAEWNCKLQNFDEFEWTTNFCRIFSWQMQL